MVFLLLYVIHHVPLGLLYDQFEFRAIGEILIDALFGHKYMSMRLMILTLCLMSLQKALPDLFLRCLVNTMISMIWGFEHEVVVYIGVQNSHSTQKSNAAQLALPIVVITWSEDSSFFARIVECLHDYFC